ncbi:DNA-binding protein [Ottowia sp.]|uniref:DNA-binding protein n=1 Tax=Ottowia sp. TaxID=1898956 RepID=UPI0025E6D8E1|nr:DNA-binding protein [Ottowia sp.]MBK6616073.1 DNA-binding protein [Ottowia sp.]
MKAGTKATRDAVFAACDEMMALGQLPALREIVKKTGGSLSTITPHRDEWWASIVRERSSAKGIKGLPDDVSALLVSVWERATNAAHELLKGFRIEQLARAEEFAAKAVAAEGRAVLADKTAAQATADADAARREAARVTEMLEQRGAEHAAVVSTLTHQIEVLGTQSADLRAAHAEEVERWVDERKRLMLQLDAQRQEVALAATATAAATRKHEKALEEALTRLAQESARAATLAETNATLRVDLASSQAREHALGDLRGALEAETRNLREQVASRDALLESQAHAMSEQSTASRTLASSVDEVRKLMQPGKRPTRKRESSASQK